VVCIRSQGHGPIDGGGMTGDSNNDRRIQNTKRNSILIKDKIIISHRI
jgi:hypothetical protein